MRRLVKIRLVRAVTYGTGPEWQPGEVRLVDPALAELMVNAGEAERIGGLDTTVAAGAVAGSHDPHVARKR